MLGCHFSYKHLIIKACELDAAFKDLSFGKTIPLNLHPPLLPQEPL